MKEAGSRGHAPTPPEVDCASLKKNKEDGIWNAWLPNGETDSICKYCAKIMCNFRSPILGGCDGFIKPKRPPRGSPSGAEPLDNIH